MTHNRQIKGIIFDVDGVIVNTEDIHYQAYKQVLAGYNYILTPELYKAHFSGKSIRGGLLSLLKEVDITQGENLEPFIAHFIEQKLSCTIDSLKGNLKFFEDTLRFIENVRAGNVLLTNGLYIENSPVLALATGMEQRLMDEILRHQDLASVFRIIITPESYSHSKPHPECYLRALEQMGMTSKEVIGIEDSPSGIKALNAASVYSIALSTSHTIEELQEAKCIADTLSSLLS